MGNSHPGSWLEGAVAGWALLLKSSDAPAEDRKHPAIDGICKVLASASTDEKPCTETYISFSHDKHETKVWVDDNGRFRFPIDPNQLTLFKPSLRNMERGRTLWNKVRRQTE